MRVETPAEKTAETSRGMFSAASRVASSARCAGLGLRLEGAEFRVQGLGFGVWG